MKIIDLDNVKVGNYTSGNLDLRMGPNSHILIGSYCSIAADVVFICGMDHNYNYFSTFSFGDGGYNRNQFMMKDLGLSRDATNIYNERCGEPDINVGSDVRIGTGAKIMGGVNIGQGAVIAAGAVVTKDIPPYAIVGGVPAKIIKYRFSDEIIEKLIKVDFNNIPIEKFLNIYMDITKSDFDVDYILSKLL